MDAKTWREREEERGRERERDTKRDLKRKREIVRGKRGGGGGLMSRKTLDHFCSGSLAQCYSS